MGQISVILINVTITRRVLSRASPQWCKELCYFPCVIVLCCWSGKLTPSSRSLWCHLLFHSSVEVWSHYSSANVDPVVTCQRFLLKPALRTWSRLTLMDNSSSPLCSTCHLMCHFDWQTNGGPICKCWLPEHPVWKDIHQNLCALFLRSLLYYLYSAVRGAVELITLYF